jgi:hypothetical protein
VTEAQPNLEHPLVEIACRLLQPDPEQRWRFDDQAADILERALLLEKSDPNLPAAVLGIFHVATDLERTHGAHAAAGRMFALLGSVGPRLFTQIPSELEDLIEQARSTSERRVLPAQHDAKPPEGTIPAHKLQPPRRR